MKILFQLSGSISCYKSCFLISKLVQEKHEVKVLCTPSALKFVGKVTLEGLTGSPVLSDTFEDSHKMDHIHLGRWADLFILCPASANIINELASGMASNIIGSLFLSLNGSKPYLIVPSMNSEMFSHPATQNSLHRLKGWGVSILETDYGSLACGEVGYGRLLNLDEIERRIHEEIDLLSLKGQKKKEEKLYFLNLEEKSQKQQERQDVKKEQDTKKEVEIERELQNKILITGGATRETIDSVRYISNISTGLTGARLCETMSLKGFHVTYLHSLSSRLPFENVNHREKERESKERKAYEIEGIKKIPFESFPDFKFKIESLLKENHFQAVIHLAALSDYSIHSIEQKGQSFLPGKQWKCSSEKGSLSLKLKKNKKLLFSLREMSKNKSIRIFAFKLTYNVKKKELLDTVQSLFEKTSADLIIHNDLYEIEQEFKKWREKRRELLNKKDKDFERLEERERDFHIFRVFEKDLNQIPFLAFSKRELSHVLSGFLLKLLHQKSSKDSKDSKESYHEKKLPHKVLKSSRLKKRPL